MLIEIKICVFNLPRSDMCVLTRFNWAVFLLLCCIRLIYFLSAYAFAYAICLCGTYLHWFWPTLGLDTMLSSPNRGGTASPLFMRTAPKFPLERTSQNITFESPHSTFGVPASVKGHQQGTGKFRMDLVRGWSWGTMSNCLNGYPFAPIGYLMPATSFLSILCRTFRSIRALRLQETLWKLPLSPVILLTHSLSLLTPYERLSSKPVERTICICLIFWPFLHPGGAPTSHRGCCCGMKQGRTLNSTSWAGLTMAVRA